MNKAFEKYQDAFARQIAGLVDPLTDDTKLFYFLRTHQLRKDGSVESGRIEPLVITPQNAEILDQYVIDPDAPEDETLPYFFHEVKAND